MEIDGDGQRPSRAARFCRFPGCHPEFANGLSCERSTWVRSTSGDSRRFLVSSFMAFFLHTIIFVMLSTVRLAENPVGAVPVTIDLAMTRPFEPTDKGLFQPREAYSTEKRRDAVLRHERRRIARRRVGANRMHPTSAPIVEKASRAVSTFDRQIPTPRQNRESLLARGPAFREARTGDDGSASPQPVRSPEQEPLRDVSAIPSQAKSTPSTPRAAPDAGQPPGIGELVEGGHVMVRGSLDLGILDQPPGRGTSAEAKPRRGGRVSSARVEDGGFHIQWDQPAEGQSRKLLAAPRPRIPQWVSKRGLSLNAVIAFVLTPDGLLDGVSVQISSGYNEVDVAVSEAVRHWRFSADPSAQPVRGVLPYAIRAR